MAERDAILGFITGPSVGIWFMHSVLNLFKEDYGVRFSADYLIAMGPYIHENRNRLTQQFLETDRTWLLMVDNDIVFKPGDALALLAEGDKRGPGIYSGPYPMESGNFVCGPWAEDEDLVMYHPIAMVPNTVVPIGMVGAGFTLIHRDVFESVGDEPWTSVSHTYGEDVSFMWRAKEKGWTPWLVPVNLGHTKSVVIYSDNNNTNLHGDNINLTRVNPLDPVFRQFQEEGVS